MTERDHTVEDLFLIDDLEAGGYRSCADWVRNHPHAEIEPRRAGLHRVLGRFADAEEEAEYR